MKNYLIIAALLLMGTLAISNSQGAIGQNGLFLKNAIGDTGATIPQGDPVEFSGEFKLKTGSEKGLLSLTATIDPAWHIFSNTQEKGGPTPSTIDVAESEQYKIIGKFVADSKPHVHDVEGFDVPCEEHEGTVTWTAQIELKKGVDPKSLTVAMVYNGQTCESKPAGSCRPIIDIDVEAKFAGFDDKIKVSTFVHKKVELETYYPDGLHAELKARVVRADGVDAPFGPGDIARLELTAKATEDYHIYTYSLEESSGTKPTIVGFLETNKWAVKGPRLSEEPEEGDSFGEKVLWHHDPITWSFDFKIPDDVEEKAYPLKGIIGMQACNAVGCDRPLGIKFSTTVPIGTSAEVAVKFVEADSDLYDTALEAIDSGGKAAPFTKAELKEAGDVGPTKKDDLGNEIPIVPDAPEKKDVPAKKEKVEHVRVQDTPEEIAEMATLYDVDEKVKYLTLSDMADNPIGSGGFSSGDNTTFLTAFVGIFLGGMLLNLMPCVFPVLGLKVMGFVQQAGSDPRKIKMHGLAFAAGLVVSMWILAGIIMFLREFLGKEINWGGQMGNPYFVGAIIVLLFVLALNMAGVFEIGTSLSGVGGGMQKKGYSGSFFSGILTTLIATPCAGPFLGVAMSYTMAQPIAIAMFLFTIFALGIATPYIVLSFFPKLIQMLPKPGPWMETFKITMAFALFATVAFFMQAFGGQTGVGGLSWMVMALVVIGLAAFFYGTWSETSSKAPAKRLLLGFVMPGIIAAVGLWMSYDAAGQQPPILAGGGSHNIGGLQWQSWNPGKIPHSLANNGKIIWVDYTASW